MSDVMGELTRLYEVIESSKGVVVSYVRGLEPVLRDHGANNLADRLMAMLGEVDAAEREMRAYIAQNGDSIASAFTSAIKRSGPR